MFRVAGSMSTNQGSAWQWRMALAVAMKEWLTVMTVSPGRTPTASRARCRAEVQLDTAQAQGACVQAAKAASNSRTRGPWVTHPERMASWAAWASSSASQGLAKAMALMLCPWVLC